MTFIFEVTLIYLTLLVPEYIMSHLIYKGKEVEYGSTKEEWIVIKKIIHIFPLTKCH